MRGLGRGTSGPRGACCRFRGVLRGWITPAQWRSLLFFFFQAEDGIRDSSVTGVQTCALPIFEKNPELLGGFLGCDCLLQFGVLFNRAFQCDSEFVRNHFSDAVGVGITQSHHSSNIADYALRAQCAKGNDLRYGSGTILFSYVVDHFSPPILAKIDVDIGRTDAFRIEKALED